MGLFDVFVDVIKSEIRFVKNAISDKHDDGYGYASFGTICTINRHNFVK